MEEQRRWYQIADITLQVESDLPFLATTFNDNIELFRIDSPGEDVVSIRHHLGLPELSTLDLSRLKFRKEPWAIYQTDDGWIYLGILSNNSEVKLWKVVKSTFDHSHTDIYHPKLENFFTIRSNSLTFFPSDQILVARLLAYRQGFYLHSAGAILEGAGVLFVGHSEAGKSTTTQMLIDAGARGDFDVEILCDDRNILRRRDEGWRIYGTWHHGDIAQVSPASAPLRSICFIEKARENSITLLNDRKEITRRLLACVIKPFLTVDWWEKTLAVVAQLVVEGQSYVMQFDRSGSIVDELAKLVSHKTKTV